MTEDRRDYSSLCDRLASIEKVLREHIMADAEFSDKYGDLIDILLMRETDRAKLRGIVIEKLLTGGVWALFVFLGFSAWEFVKRNINGY